MKRKAGDLWTRLTDALRRDPDLDDRETGRLMDLRNAEVEAELPHPRCCDGAKHIYPYLDDEAQVDVAPSWELSFSTDWYGQGPRRSLPVHFCPFCGSGLPRLRKKATPSSHLRVVKDGGYYCDTCRERLDSCHCSLAESAFECVPAGPPAAGA